MRQLAERRAVERREAAVQQLSRQHEQLERAATEHGVRHDRAVGQARRSHWGHLERLRGCRGGPSVVQAEEALQGLLRADEGRLEHREPPLRGCLRQHVRLLRALRRRLSDGEALPADALTSLYCQLTETLRTTAIRTSLANVTLIPRSTAPRHPRAARLIRSQGRALSLPPRALPAAAASR